MNFPSEHGSWRLLQRRRIQRPTLNVVLERNTTSPPIVHSLYGFISGTVFPHCSALVQGSLSTIVSAECLRPKDPKLYAEYKYTASVHF